MADGDSDQGVVEARIGVVAIGRNEGERLRRCLQTMPDRAAHVVYVDSGSGDGSVAVAREHGAAVVELDPSRPFCASRARNAGLAKLKAIAPESDYVQFIDGDCELAPDWLGRAVSAIQRDSDLAVVCGRRRETAPRASIYNRLCDLEWDTPVGEAKACGGDALMRVDALEQVGGFDESVVAGEEPELCFRLRRAGWRIRRIEGDMTYHDAAMHRFGQWWQRAVRGGHAVGQAMAMHGSSSERFGVRTSLSIWLWAVGLPLLTLPGLFAVGGWAFLLLLAYPVQTLRIAWKQRGRGWSWADCLLYAMGCVVGKFAQLQGQCLFWWRVLRRRQAQLIEYKRAGHESG